MWEKHSATEKLMGLPVSEVWPKHVRELLQPCTDCENELPCKFYRGDVEQGGEERESGLDDASCDTSGIGSDDSGHSGVAKDNAKSEKKHKEKKKAKEKRPKEKAEEKTSKEAKACTS